MASYANIALHLFYTLYMATLFYAYLHISRTQKARWARTWAEYEQQEIAQRARVELEQSDSSSDEEEIEEEEPKEEDENEEEEGYINNGDYVALDNLAKEPARMKALENDNGEGLDPK